MEDGYYYVRDKASKSAHHWDYLEDSPRHALCGHQYEEEITYEGAVRPSRVCRRCQTKLLELKKAPQDSEIAALNARCIKLQANLEDTKTTLKQLREEIRQRDRIAATVRGRPNPPQYFVVERGSRVAHHWDYLKDRNDTALCGHEYNREIASQGHDIPAINICEECTKLVPSYEAMWWRETAHIAENLRRKFQQKADLTDNKLKAVRQELDTVEAKLGTLQEQSAHDGLNDPLLRALQNS